MMMELKIRMAEGERRNEILLEWTMQLTTLTHDPIYAVVGTRNRGQ
jgi:hypothetical protein